MMVQTFPVNSHRAAIGAAFGLGYGFFAGAGVTGLSMWIGLIGIWALVWALRGPQRPLVQAHGPHLKRCWWVYLPFVAFVIWVLISAQWSPAQVLAGESVRRLTAMAVLAPLAVWVVASNTPEDQTLTTRGFLAGLFLALAMLAFETLTGDAMNRLASPEKEPLAIDGDLGRAAAATLPLFWLGFAHLKLLMARANVFFPFVMIAVLISLQFGTDLNGVGFALSTLAALIALWLPRVAIGALTGLAATLMAGAPVIYPLIHKIALHYMPSGTLPLSYARRGQMWDVAADLVHQKPFTGWGLGAGSTFDRIIEFGGMEWPLIQLHPHAAPMHIWLETGAIGAGLCTLAIVAAGVSAMTVFGRSKIAASALVGGLSFVALNWAMSHAAWREWMWTSLAAVIAFSLALRTVAFARPEPERDWDDFEDLGDKAPVP